MPSDIILEDQAIKLIGQTVVAIHAHDVTLEHPERRGEQNRERPRRALVHDFNDGLTINWDLDYPGGVTVRGHLQSTDSASFAHVHVERLVVASRVQLDRPDDWPALEERPPAEGARAPAGGRASAVVDRRVPGLPGARLEDIGRRVADATHIDLVDELKLLRRELATLKAKVAELEGRR